MSEETYIIKSNDFAIDNINSYLENIKNILIKMNIKLDSQEINKFLAISLNNSLFTLIDSNYNKNLSFQLIHDNWEEITKNIPNIEQQIRNFNKEQNYEYYVNIEDVTYLRFYKQIKYVTEIINEVIQYLNFGVNPVYIYTFIIQSFYDETSFIENYIYFIGEIKKKINDPNINIFLGEEIIAKLNVILRVIFEYDTEFNKLMESIFSDRIQFIKKGIITSTLSYPNNYNCQEKIIDNKDSIKIKTEKKQNRDIEELERHFYKLKCEMLFKKRPFLLSDKFYFNVHELANVPVINREIWLGFILFLYKKFEFKYDDFKAKIIELINTYGLNNNYIPELDYFEDLNVPKYEYKEPQTGGNNRFFIKYLKYKSKYIKLKKNNVK
jgi:hypothetical protein